MSPRKSGMAPSWARRGWRCVDSESLRGGVVPSSSRHETGRVDMLKTMRVFLNGHRQFLECLQCLMPRT